jgi:hypothetical protein
MRADAPKLPLVLAALGGGLALFVAGVACEKEVDDATEPGSREWCDNRVSAARKAGDDCEMWGGRVTECRLQQRCRATDWCEECDYQAEQEFNACEGESYLWESVNHFCAGQ